MMVPHSETLNIANQAFEAFSSGIAHGDWSAFLNWLSEDFTFWFPAGPYQGWNQGKDRASEFLHSVSRVFPQGLTLTIEQVTSNDTTVVFEVRSEGMMQSHAYQNQAAIAFDVKDGKICAYREYLGVIYQLK
ncbi:MAG: nuclear transport factor 2 family protein [Leptolyngbya sp. IPPAS B-1204]|nr:nuclear transport factor 2 family protein [Elainella sp. C42_A2020_010]RNJ70838.1 MAG: nuclear transport factor 2 family protein [Leptolyngbya sp. IPPAS B-1204]